MLPVARRPAAESHGDSSRGCSGAGAAAAAIPDWAGANAADERPFSPLRREDHRRQPNLLVILADDLGWADLSCFGAPTIRTPNLDKLAASGVRFTQGYSASSVCSPTRFGFYTGRYPGRLAGGLREPIGEPNEIDGIPLDHPTLATQLKSQGYETGLIGKWHCGYLPWFSPTRLGWDEFFGNVSGGLDYFSKINHNGDHDLYEDEVEVEDLRYYTPSSPSGRPSSYAGPGDRARGCSTSTSPRPTGRGRTRGQGRERRAHGPDGGRRAGVLFHEDGGSLETYREMVEDLDQAIGSLISALRRSGELENTLVFSGGKGDGHATFLELAGADPDPDYPLDGFSLVDHLFAGGRVPKRDLFWRMRGERALRRGDLKYVRLSDGADHLYDLEADAREQADLAGRRPEDLAALRGAWEKIEATLLPYPG